MAFAVSLQLVFILWLARGIRVSTSQKNQPLGQGPPVSVLVCARNEVHNLRELLPLLLQQNHPQFEVVVVDDRSDDDTYDYLLELSATEKRIKPVRVDRTPHHINPKKYALTLGIKAAAYDWLLLTDADCRPVSKGWIAAMSRHMIDPAQFVLGISPYQPQPGLLNAFIRFETLYTAAQYVGLAGNKQPYMGVGRNLAYRKSFFMQQKGFNGFQHLNGGDDDLLVNRHATWQNTQTCTDTKCLMISIPKTSWTEFINQKKRHLMAGRYYRARHKIILGAIQASHLISWTGALALLTGGHRTLLVAGMLLLRTAAFSIFMTRTARKLGFEMKTLLLPVLDFLYMFYYLTTAPRAWVAKRITWKN